MKRIKIMLTSLALFAVVGGALAFKANFNGTFCTATPGTPGPNVCAKACPNFTTKVQPGSTGDFVCTAEYDDNNCQTPPQCERVQPVQLIPNGGN